MKKLNIFLLLLITFVWSAKAQTADSVDMLDYDLSFDFSQGRPFLGDATLTLRLTRPCDSIALSLIGTLDSMWVNGTRITEPRLQAIPVAGIPANDSITLRVCYHSNGYVESGGWGGFHYDNNMHYNLGVGFDANPHVMGRAIMPCRDNFYDKATYTLRVHTGAGWTAECGGELLERTVESDNTEHSVWRIAQPTPTYLVSVSQSTWQRLNKTIPSLYGTYPLTVGFTNQNSTQVARAFVELDSVVPMFERCFGPYRWGRIGYIATNKGSMEHVNNIALDRTFINSTGERAQMTIAHELGHAWFGNLITCSTEGDMWINEGGASFTSEVAMESTSGRAASNKYYQTNLESVLRATHITDNGYRPLSGMPHNYTYNTTTYDKGWMVWHSLRGYLGDSLFYASISRLMESKAFDIVDAYDVRDSLSLYSGVDLTDFFAFHVFNPGFVDYYVVADYSGDTPSHAHVTVRQQGVGTQAVAHANRVPVTFFSRSGASYKHRIDFAGSDTSLTVELPFNDPVYCVLDYDLEFSDAATVADFDISSIVQHTGKECHIRIYSNEEHADRVRVAVEHHWGLPWDTDTVPGILRTAKRYWVVRGTHDYLGNTTGYFHYVRGDYESSTYSYLDNGFFNRPTSLDSIAVLYREGPGRPWVAVGREHSSSTNDGYFTIHYLRPGEYTLAVIDTSLMAIASPDGTTGPLSLFPNPVRSGMPLTIETPVDDSFTLTVVDAAGRQVWRKKNCHNGMKITPKLASGTYFVRIENKFVSLQSKLIVL